MQGFFAGLAWKGFETYSQYSFRNLCLVSVDWVRTASHVHVILSLFNCECHVTSWPPSLRQQPVPMPQVRTKVFGRDISRV